MADGYPESHTSPAANGLWRGRKGGGGWSGWKGAVGFGVRGEGKWVDLGMRGGNEKGVKVGEGDLRLCGGRGGPGGCRGGSGGLR